jgi:hypothetical protein
MRLPWQWALAAILMCSCLAGTAEPPAKQKDPQSSYEPRSAPGAGQKFLETFVGNWEVVKTFHPRFGDPVRVQGACRQTMIHGGRFLQSEFVFHSAGAKTTGLGLIGFEADSGVFTSVWTDSRSTRMSLRRSQDKFDGKQIVLYSRSLQEGKESRRSRTVTRLEDDGRKILHRQYTSGPGGKERLVMELVMMRKPLTPVDARKKVGEKITVEMTVRAAKDRLERRGEIYLDAEMNFRDEKNFAVVITKTGAESLKKAGIADPAEHFKDKTIRATGTVKEVEKVPRIEIDDAKQIRLVKGK